MSEEDKVIVKIDSQILNSIDLCATRYNYEHVHNFRPIKKAEALEHGGVMHSMLAHYYRQKMNGRIPTEHGVVVEESILIGRQEASNCSFDLIEFEEQDVRTFKDYVLAKQYDGWQVLDVERPFTIELYNSEDLQILYEGIIDLLIRDPKEGKAVVDHKTESRRSTPFELSNQFQGYQWAFKLPVCVNKIGYQTSLPNNEKFRHLWYPPHDVLLAEWREDAIRSIKRAIGWHQEDYFPRDRTSCDKYSGCIFQRVCKAPPEVRDFKLGAYYIKDKPWDPYTRDDE